MSKIIQLERVQFRDAVHLPCTDGQRDSALAWRDDRPGHVLELDLSTRMVTISASESMKSFRGLTSANRNHVIDVPLENVAYTLRLTDATRDLIAGAKAKTRAQLAAANLTEPAA